MTPAIIETSRPTREFAISVMTGVLRVAADNLPPEIASQSLDDLEVDRKPTEVDYFLRRNLWKQVELAQKGLITEIEPRHIYGGVCAQQNYERIAKYPKRLAWLLTYPEPVQDRLEAGLSIALTNLLKFVSKEPTSETASAFMKAIDILLNRVQGPIIQKIQAQHAHLNLNKPVPAQHDVNKRIEELKTKLIRDVSPSNEKA